MKVFSCFFRCRTSPKTSAELVVGFFSNMGLHNASTTRSKAKRKSVASSAFVQDGLLGKRKRVLAACDFLGSRGNELRFARANAHAVFDGDDENSPVARRPSPALPV